MPDAPAPTDITHAVETIRRGGMVLITDDGDDARGGIVVAAAERTSDDTISFMATHTGGLVAVALLPQRATRLGLVAQGTADGVARLDYTNSIEARHGVSTGISAADRARTVQVLADHQGRAEDLVSPGHVFPVLALPAGIVARPGWAEAAVDLARAAGVQPIATFCQVLGADGELATGQALTTFAARHGLPSATTGDLIRHRMAGESFVTQLSQSTLPTARGEFRARAFVNRLDGQQHVALTLGEVRTSDPLLVRVHSECLTGDVFGSRRCDCGGQLDEALRRIQAEGRGVLLYLRQEGRGIGLVNKVRAYQLQDAGRDTVEANVELGLPVDQRDYGVAAQMLLALGVQRVALMTNNPEKVAGLERHGIAVLSRETIEITPTDDNLHYLETKKQKLGHLLDKV